MRPSEKYVSPFETLDLRLTQWLSNENTWLTTYSVTQLSPFSGEWSETLDYWVHLAVSDFSILDVSYRRVSVDSWVNMMFQIYKATAQQHCTAQRR
jgi:hypothetical protein